MAITKYYKLLKNNNTKKNTKKVTTTTTTTSTTVKLQYLIPIYILISSFLNVKLLNFNFIYRCRDRVCVEQHLLWTNPLWAENTGDLELLTCKWTVLHFTM